MCGRLHCCIDEETGECYRRLPQVKSGCASYCDIPHRNVTACDAENEDSCVEMGCCWFPVSDRPPCYEPAAYVPPTTQNPINRPKAIVRSPYYYSSIVSSKPAEIKNPLIVGYAWADWLDSVCTADCNGVGVKIRRRTCTAYTKYGNSPVNRNFCKGPDKKAELCVGPPCSHNDFQITVPTKTDSETNQKKEKPLIPDLESNSTTMVCCVNQGKLYDPGEIIFKTSCLTIFCSISCKVDMEMNEACDGGQEPPPLPEACFPSECGEQKAWRIKKIVGGSWSPMYGHPWAVMMKKQEGVRSFVCGATMICSKFVLTAAHCFADQTLKPVGRLDFDTRNYRFFFGRYFGNDEDSEKFDKHRKVVTGDGIEFMITHPDFEYVGKGVMKHDIGIVKFRNEMEINDYVKPVCLPTARDDVPNPNEAGWAIGWGITKNRGPSNHKLKQVGVQIVDENSCRRKVDGFPDSGRGLICGGGSYGHDTCVGDSGGPVLGYRAKDSLSYSSYTTSKDKTWTIFGITSVGGTSCNTIISDVQPAVYTNVAYYLDWIIATTAGCCDSS
ncbi:Oidioi.mRNA.OKI2018_I69.chr1.g2659.t1.cds [Oikopleura dioica]|uniref:Oidioi.mRNA.OKI2018_I69.chr1.g2659.t1.cds n=1 Tax=Oikopleura dioica TaxID=34765 RepID=A0ABN7SRS2_OIKDI|nr:Oidioi.mRNA.OKI2018_I69.chr1.g2659.t1.cds [Oikopleura dioica]